MLKKWFLTRNSFTALKPFTAMQDSLQHGYNKKLLSRDIVAGLTVGIIALPLSMALAIASGVPPQHGLYTAIVAGILIALTGGSRFNISGPTAAFVVILYPITQQYGLSGLLMATLLSGIILILMALFRLGRLVEYIPLSVTLGFTCGIGVVIATLQIKDFFGLDIATMPTPYIEKIAVIIQYFSSFQWADTLIGVITLSLLILWPRLRLPIPGHLPAVVIATLVALFLTQFQIEVSTIGSSFEFIRPDGTVGQGIPDSLPTMHLPWNIPDAQGKLIHWDFASLQSLLPAAFSMAMLGAIESLLCAVILDNMTNTRHHSNNELLAQGLGNLASPFFGGITATAAIARSAANVKAGAYSPIASVIHALFVLASLLLIAPILSYLPLSAMAALLLMVAWQMSNIPQIIQLIRRAGRNEMAVLLTCFFLTVFFDMVIAISVGVILASLLFIRTIAEMTKTIAQATPKELINTVIYRINGPLFFAAADNLFADLHDKIKQTAQHYQHIVLICDAVTVLDTGGVHALTRFIQTLQPDQQLHLCNMQFQPLKRLVKSGHVPEIKQIQFSNDLNEVIKKITVLQSTPTDNIETI